MDDRHAVHGEQVAALRRSAASVLSQRGWSLLTLDETVARGAALLSGGAFSPSAAVLHVYAQALYSACAGGEGPARQDAAYDELFRYVYDLARYLAGDLGREAHEDLANQVVADLFYRLSGADSRLSPIRTPGAFLAVAIQHTRNAIRRWRRDPFGSAAPDEHHPAREQDQPEALAEASELRERVRRYFHRALQRYPRARTQLAVLWMRSVEGADYETIGERLQLAVPNVRVLYARGKSRLQDDLEWRQLACELGLLEEPTYHEPQRTRLARMKGA